MRGDARKRLTEPVHPTGYAEHHRRFLVTVRDGIGIVAQFTTEGDARPSVMVTSPRHTVTILSL